MKLGKSSFVPKHVSQIYFELLHISKAEACKSIEYAMKKCPNGMYAEIKYDGERVQVHKNGDHFSYFSRSLKPVLPHKVSTYKLPQLLCQILPFSSINFTSSYRQGRYLLL